MKKRWFNMLALLIVLLMILSACGESNPSSASADTNRETTGQGDTASQEDAAPEETTPEVPEPKSTSYCFYVKDNQVFYIDNINKTPILLVDELYTGSFAADGDLTNCVDDVFDLCFHECYPSLGLVLYSDRSFSSRYGSDRDITADNLCLKDVSSPDGETIHIADNVENDLTYFVPKEMAIYYTVRLFDTLTVGIDETSYQKYRYDVQTRESVPWEQGEFYTGILVGSERCKKWYGLETSELQEDDNLLYEYSSGEKYYYRYMAEDKSVANIYYWDGTNETFVCEMNQGLFEKSTCSAKPLIAIETTHSKAVVIVKDQAFDLNPLFAEGSDVYEVVFSADGSTGYCSVFHSYTGDGERGLYKFSIGEDGIGPMELIDADVASVDGATTLSRVCWVNGDNAFYVHKDATLYCNGTLVDPQGSITKICTFFGDELLYQVYGSSFRNNPYTLKAANDHDSRTLNEVVLKYKKSGNSLWYLGDFDLRCMGVLYLIDDGECIPIESDIYMID